MVLYSPDWTNTGFSFIVLTVKICFVTRLLSSTDSRGTNFGALFTSLDKYRFFCHTPNCKSVSSPFAFRARTLLDERILISSLSGKALTMLVEWRLPAIQHAFFQAESSKLDIKRHKPGVLFISLQIGSHFKQAIM